jgi:uncharacterized phiE125 gp8 family phage protein
MAITVTSPPAALPVTLAEAKAYARVVDDDDLIESLIFAARDHVEQATGRIMVATTFELTLDEFPDNEILLPRSPLLTVASVKYDDTDGNEQTLSTSDYTVDTASEPGWIVPSTDTRWPTTFDGINAVRILAGTLAVLHDPNACARRCLPAAAKWLPLEEKEREPRPAPQTGGKEMQDASTSPLPGLAQQSPDGLNYLYQWIGLPLLDQAH